MISQDTYDNSYFCKIWAKTPAEAAKKLQTMKFEAELQMHLAKNEEELNNAHHDLKAVKQDYKKLGIKID